MKTRIKELRLEKKLTQQALAKQLGINQTSLSKIESETSVPDAALLKDLSLFFHVSTDYILYLSEERLNADYFLANNMHYLKKYRRLIAIYQKMNHRQQGDCYNFLCSMMNIEEDL
ncbi:MAG: helix-turn-helix domain-containing protein [Clostridiales bacterium]|nr:helix-turn-helix domain-containing protein [Clostridiales bacterium]